jgi:O-antigen/teichoic acid export membrane protein
MTTPPPNGAPGFMRESSRIGLNVIALIVSRFLCLALSLVQMGVIFRVLGVEGSGQFGFALNYPALFTVFATLGVPRLLVRDIARDPRIAWTYVWTATGVMAFLSIVVLGVIGASISVIEGNPTVRAAVMMASLSVILLWAMQRPFEALLTARQRMVSIATVNFIAGAARLVCTWYALQIAPTSVMAHAAIALGNLLGFLLCVTAAVWLVGWERPHFRLSLALDQVRGSAAFFCAILFSLIYFKSDMSILKWLQGDNATGIYTVAQRVMEPLLMIATIWGTAVFPALCRFSVLAPDNYDRLTKTSARLSLLIAFPMAFGVAFLAEPIVALLTGSRAGEFGEAVFVLRALSGVTPFFYVNGVAQEFLYSSHRNWFVANTYGAASVLSILGNVVLIPHLGVPGVVYTAIAANAFISLVFIWGMRSVYGAMNLVSLVGKTVAACLVMGYAAYRLAMTSLVAGVATGALLYVAVQVLLRTLDPEERRLVANMIAGPFRRFAPRANGPR